MKTEQDWVAEFSKPNANWIELVRAIRLDAFKAGMLKSSKLVSQYLDFGRYPPETLSEILKEKANQLKKLPNETTN